MFSLKIKGLNQFQSNRLTKMLNINKKNKRIKKRVYSFKASLIKNKFFFVNEIF